MGRGGGGRGGAYLIEWPWGKRLFEEICYHKSYCYPRRWKESLLMRIYFFVTFNAKGFHSTKHAYVLRFLRVLI